MNLHEYQSKFRFAEFGIPTPRGKVATTPQEAYEIAREGSLLPQAQLVIEETPLLAHCPTCRATRAVVSVQQLCCTDCGTPTPELLSGRELEVVALEIQT